MVPVSSWDVVAKKESCVFSGKKSMYLLLIRPENLSGSYGGLLAQMHSWSRDKLTSCWLSSREPHCSMSNSLQCVYTFWFQLWMVVLSIRLCAKIFKRAGRGKKLKIQMEREKKKKGTWGSSGIVFVYQTSRVKARRHDEFCSSYGWIKWYNGWAWYIQTLDYRSVLCYDSSCISAQTSNWIQSKWRMRDLVPHIKTLFILYWQ